MQCRDSAPVGQPLTGLACTARLLLSNILRAHPCGQQGLSQMLVPPHAAFFDMEQAAPEGEAFELSAASIAEYLEPT